jgi:hypothetical protein
VADHPIGEAVELFRLRTRLENAQELAAGLDEAGKTGADLRATESEL